MPSTRAAFSFDPLLRFVRNFAAVILLIGVAASVAACRKSATSSPELSTPMLALQRLPGGKWYFNAAARPWLAAQRSDLIAQEQKDENSELSRAMVQAVQNPKLFRQLDRRERFDGLLFVGDPSQSRTLLEHLLESKDWTLTDLDHTSLVFRRSGDAWKPENLAPLRAKFGGHDLAVFLSQAATKMLAVRMTEPAKALLDDARSADSRAPEVAAAFAIYRMNRGEWAAAEAETERALKADPKNLSAIATKTQVLFATKRFSAAYDLSKQLIATAPDDPALLFYHAKLAHEAHAYGGEIEALNHLIELAEKARISASGYRVYLGQAYAGAGDAKPAIDAFNAALADPELPEEQRKFAQGLLDQVRQRSGR